MNLLENSATTKYIVLTHQPCRDGFVASLCARKYYLSKYGAKYGDLMPMFWGVEPSKQAGDLKSLMTKINQMIRKTKFEQSILNHLTLHLTQKQ